MNQKIAKAARMVTIPPVTVFVLMLLLWFMRRSLFASVWQLVVSLVFLMIVPILAYPLQPAIPYYRKKGRDGQRDFAFVTTFIGYIGAVIYGFAGRVSMGLMVIYVSYFLSYSVLLLMNQFGGKASGHACGLVGPMALIIYSIGGLWCIIPCAALYVLITWSSLTLGRHTPAQLIWGSLSALIGFAGGALLVPLLY